MTTQSKGGRSYSDPTYGSVKTMKFSFAGSTGTRTTAVISTIKPMTPISVIDWQMTANAAGAAGSMDFVICATSSIGTSALGTITFSGTNAANTTVDGSVTTEAAVAAGGAINLYSVLGTCDPASTFFAPTISYRETFVVSDN